jgi:predicted nucleic acid-binding protein
MATSTFVDTSGFYALLVQNDSVHEKAVSILNKAALSKARFVTSDYILDETVTLLKARGHGHLIESFLDSVLTSKACTVHWMDPQRFESTRQFHRKHSDKAWSFTDCFSFCTMQEKKLRRALTKDAHFGQAGFEPLLV